MRSRSSIRVLHMGNLGNNAYREVKFLRRRGIEADLLVFSGELEGNTHPRHEDLQNYRGLPDWVKVEHELWGRRPDPKTRPVDWLEWRAQLPERVRRFLGGYDIVQAYCTTSIWVRRFMPEDGPALITFSTGSDLRELATLGRRRRARRLRQAYRYADLKLSTTSTR